MEELEEKTGEVEDLLLSIGLLGDNWRRPGTLGRRDDKHSKQKHQVVRGES